jgi:hypothetical protein
LNSSPYDKQILACSYQGVQDGKCGISLLKLSENAIGVEDQELDKVEDDIQNS